MATPLNTEPPVITVTGNAPNANLRLASNGTWTGTATINYAYQWLNGTNISSLSNIDGATANTFQTNSSYAGNVFVCRIIGTNAEGSNLANTMAFVNSNQLANVDIYKAVTAPVGNTFLVAYDSVLDADVFANAEGNVATIIPTLEVLNIANTLNRTMVNIDPTLSILALDVSPEVGLYANAEGNVAQYLPSNVLTITEGIFNLTGLGISVATVYAATDSEPIKVVGSGTYWTTG